MRLEPKTVIEPLWFGTNIHLALATYYDPSSPRDPKEAIDVFKETCYRYLAQFESPDPDKVVWVDEMVELGTGMLNYYFLWAERHDDFEVIAVEMPFDVGIPGLPGVSYAGTLDGLVRDPSGRYWILEHKTTAQFYESQDFLVNDDQVGSYYWALTQLDPPILVEGVLYNNLKKKVPKDLRPLKRGGFSVNKSQDTTFDIAITQLREHYGKVPREYWDFLDHLKYKPDNFVQRDYIRRNRRELEMLGQEMRWEVLDMVNNPAIYRTPSRINCNGCPFYAPCIAKWENSDYQYMLDTMYTISTRR
jgi:hypothetical protein